MTAISWLGAAISRRCSTDTLPHVALKKNKGESEPESLAWLYGTVMRAHASGTEV